MSWLKRAPEVEYRVVEVEKGPTSLGSSADIASLAEHPGMHALMARLRVQRSMLDSALRSNRHDSLADVAKLQAGIQWIAWIERQVNLAVGKSQPERFREPFELERQELEKIVQALQIVGKNGE